MSSIAIERRVRTFLASRLPHGSPVNYLLGYDSKRLLLLRKESFLFKGNQLHLVRKNFVGRQFVDRFSSNSFKCLSCLNNQLGISFTIVRRSRSRF